MTDAERDREFVSVWDGKASLLPDRPQHDPGWWLVGEQTRQQRRRDSRARQVGRARKNYAWRVKHAAVLRVRAGETIRTVADDLDLPYYTVRNWVAQLRG